MAERAPEPPAPAGPDLAALAAITDAVEDGAGLPAVLRAAARALDTSLILIDRSAAVLAVAARSPADERSLMRDGDDVTDDRPEGRRRNRREGCGCGPPSARPTPRYCASSRR